MGRYSREPDNATKSCKARGPNLRVHFKVSKAIPLRDADGRQTVVVDSVGKSVVMCMCVRMCNINQ